LLLNTWLNKLGCLTLIFWRVLYLEANSHLFEWSSVICFTRGSLTHIILTWKHLAQRNNLACRVSNKEENIFNIDARCLQFLGDHYNMYRFTKLLCRCCSPIIHSFILQDYLRSPEFKVIYKNILFNQTV
jgi:hypothetical protein